MRASAAGGLTAARGADTGGGATVGRRLRKDRNGRAVEAHGQRRAARVIFG